MNDPIHKTITVPLAPPMRLRSLPMRSELGGQPQRDPAAKTSKKRQETFGSAPIKATRSSRRLTAVTLWFGVKLLPMTRVGSSPLRGTEA